MGDFEKDLHEGQSFEDEVIEYFKENHMVHSSQDKGQFKDYDLLLDQGTEQETKIEIKLDRMAWWTKNTAHEIGTKYPDGTTRDSGLSSTKASVYVVGFKNMPGVYSIPADTLKQMVKDRKNFTTSYYTGDGGATIALFNLDLFLNHCTFLFNRKTKI